MYKRQGQGALEWREARPGRLSLLVEAEGLLPYRRDLDLEAGERQRITAQLLDHIPLRGRAVDSHGLAVANASIWLLGGGEAHPVEGANLKDRLRAVTNKSGEFGIEIPAEGSWRFSAGPPGEILATSEALDLSLGGPSNLEVVLPGRGLLDVRLDNAPYLQLPLGQRKVLIGRHSHNEINLRDGSVSRHHAMIVPESGNWILVDLNSTNGTQVNGESVKHRRLDDGDVITVGNFRIEFRGGRDSAAGQVGGAEHRRTVVLTSG